MLAHFYLLVFGNVNEFALDQTQVDVNSNNDLGSGHIAIAIVHAIIVAH